MSTRGSGNVYRDFHVPDADVRQLKAVLAAAIMKTLGSRVEVSVRVKERKREAVHA